MKRAVPSVQIPELLANETQAAANGESSVSQIKQPDDHNHMLPVNPPSTKQVALTTETLTTPARLRRTGAGAAPFFAAGLTGIGGTTTGALAAEVAAAGEAAAAPDFPSRIAFNISCGESFGPTATTTGFATGSAAATSTAGDDVVAAGTPALFARMAAMISLVELGFAAVAADFGAAAVGAVASGTEAGAAGGLTAGASTAGIDAAAAAF